MKRWSAVLLVLIVSAIIYSPVAAETINYDDAPEITFHVFDYWAGPSPSTLTVPDDSVNRTIVEGVYDGDWSNEMSISFENVCDGEDCWQQDIYIDVTMVYTWTNNYEVVPLNFMYGGLPLQQKTLTCAYADEHGGTCYLTHYQDMITAESLSEEDPQFHLGFDFSARYGGGHINVQYKVIVSTTPISTGCEDQYLNGTKLGTVTLDAADALGETLHTLTGWPFPGGWVALKITAGTWQNNGSGAHRTDVAVKQGTGSWAGLSEFASTGCENINEATYYMQINSRASYTLRVNDDDDVWNTNTGTLTVEIYRTTFTPFPDPCEGMYKKGVLLESKLVSSQIMYVTMGDRVSAEYKNKDLALGGEKEEARLLILEVYGGPFFTSTVYSNSVEIYDGSAWYEAGDLPTIVCKTDLDTMGKVRIVFPASYVGTNDPFHPDVFSGLWKLRATDTDSSRGNNFGSIGYSLYYADSINKMPDISPGETPPLSGCDNFKYDTASIQGYSLNGNDADGMAVSFSGSTDGIYAIKTTAGPWTNNGVNSYDVAISDDNGASWSLLYRYDNLACVKSTDANHVLAYFKAIQGLHYKFRVYDSGGNYLDNSGSVGISIYGGSTSLGNWRTCGDEYIGREISLPDASRTIPAQNEGGVAISAITAGSTWGIEITDEHAWNSLFGITGVIVPDYYTAQVSDDNGATWQDMPEADFAICAVRLEGVTDNENNSRFRIYFYADKAGVYKIRVKGVVWPTNLGYLMYKLYKVEDVLDPADLPSSNPETAPTSGIPPEWATSCFEPCQRPEQLVDMQPFSLGTMTFGSLGSITFPNVNLPIPAIADWFEYGRCAIQQYLQWCPQHTAALIGIFNGAAHSTAVSDREPFATMNNLSTLFTSVQDQLTSFDLYVDIQSMGGEQDQVFGGEPGQTFGGESAEGGTSIIDMLVPSENTTSNPWFGGDVDLTGASNAPDLGGEDTFTPICIDRIEPFIGTMAGGYCGVTGWMQKNNISKILIGVLDFVIIVWMAFKYFPGYVRRMWLLLQKLGKSL